MIGAVNYFNNKADNVLNQITGKYETVPVVAIKYKRKGMGSVVMGEENFGEGSSGNTPQWSPGFLMLKLLL